jgi:hypothetical protein
MVGRLLAVAGDLRSTMARLVVAARIGENSTTWFAGSSSTRSIIGIGVTVFECSWGCWPAMAATAVAHPAAGGSSGGKRIGGCVAGR